MAEYEYEQLKHMTVADLRDIAKQLNDDSLEGYSTMHKEQLLPELCRVMDIHIHHAAEGKEKLELKAKIRKLKVRRDEALVAGDHKQLKTTRRQIHNLKHRLRLLAKQTA